MGAPRIVDAGFAEPEAREYAPEYVHELLETWREGERSLSRATVLMFIAAVAAELITRGKVKEVSVGFIRVTDLTLVSKIMPIAVAYLYSTIGSLAAENSLMETAFRETVRRIWPSMYRANLERPLYPANASLVPGDKLIYTYSQERRLRTLIDASSAFRVFVLVLTPPVFLGYIALRLIDRFGADPVTLVSVLASSILVLSGIIGVFAAGTALEDEGAMSSPP